MTVDWMHNVDRLYEIASRGEKVPADIALAAWDEWLKRGQQLAAKIDTLSAQVKPDAGGSIIAVGEPGCYVVPGHIDDNQKLAMLRATLDQYEEDGLEGLSMPRHTWMQVTRGEDGDDWYFREVYEHEEGAEPYTLIECEGYWIAPWERKELVPHE